MIDEDDIPTGEVPLDALEEEEEEHEEPRLTFDWLIRFRNMVDEMYRRDEFEVVQFDFYDPVPQFVEETMEHGLGTTFPPAIKSLYKVTDGVDFAWNYRDEDGELVEGGQIHLFAYGEVFGSWLDELWGTHRDEATDQEIDFSWNIRAIEYVPKSDLEYYTVMHMAEKLPTYRLYYHAPDGKTLRLDVDFVEYMECLLETRGIYGWQFLVSDVDFDDDDEARAAAEQFYEMMEKLFPKTELDRYREVDS